MMASTPTSLCELFTQSVQKYPDNLAVDHEDGCLTYRELDDVSSSLAHDLAHLGVNDGSPVLLVTAHGSFNIIAILAILKAGGCFVPIDRKLWSTEMVNYVCTTVNSQVIINTTTEPFTAASGSHHVLHLTSLPSKLPSHSYPSSFYRLSNADACIIFTSGSTGQPKGVVLSHKSLCLYSKTSPMNLDIGPGDRLLHILSVAFDACACMLFSALGNGSTVVPTQAEDIYVKASSCSVMAATPSILSNLPRATSNSSIFASIHTVILGGETAASDLLESWVDAGVRVLVGYGATETTSMGSVHVVARDLKTQTINPSLIGGSIEQSPIWLVNRDFQPIEDEFLEGEIIISGECISRGYYQDDIKTDDSFIYWNSLRVYKTGDYGRWVRGPSGDRVVEFRGRKDRTVKNGGFLVNLDRDVENALYHAGMSLGVTSVYAAVTEDGIVAVVTPKSVDVIALSTKARQTMCSYCIPYRLEALQKFPVSSNGKVQQKRVLEIISAIDCGKDLDLYTTTPSSLAAEGSNTEPMEEQEKLSKVLSAASSVFGYSEGKLREIKGSDSFPKLGGSSLLAFKLISILRLHNLRIIPKDLFSCRTFEEIAKEATNISFSDYEVPGADGNSIITQKLTALRKQARDILGLADESFDIGPLASLQLVLAVPTLSNKSKNINQVKLTYSGAYASMMERAWRIVWQAEPVFRTEISLAIGCGAQIIYRQPFRKPIKESYSSLADYDAAVKKVNVNVGLGCSLEFIVYRPATSSEITAVADAAAISKLAEELTIVLTVHHSLMDGVSLQILLTKVERAARGWPLPFSVDSTKANLGLISIQQNRDVAARNFFSEYLKKSRLKNGLYNNCNGIVKGEDSLARQDNTILLRSPVKNDEVADFARRSCVSTACIYYTAWAMAMSAIERDSTVIIGSVFSNRGLQPEFEDTIGLYISTLPLVIKLDDDESVVSLLQQVMSDIITIGQYAWASSDQIGIGSRIRSLVSIQPSLPNENSNPPAIQVESLESSDFPLSLLIESNGEFRIVYDGHAFNKTTIRRLGGHFKHALRGILHYALVGECRKINELLEMVHEQSEEVKIERNTQTVKQALEASIDRFQDLVAIEDYTGTSLTYGQLDEQTNIIAGRINERLADLDATAIAVYGDGSIEWLLGLLAILKTGRAFVPIDPKWPMERKLMVLEASDAAAILIPDSFHRNQVPEVAEREILVVKTLLSHKINEQETARLPDLGSADSVLVFIFTSGTTGVPKGIPTTNQSFLALQSNPEATMFAAPGRRIAQFMSPAFDVCSVEIFSALLHGATLVLRDPEDPFAHLSRVNTAIMTPAVLSVLKPDEFPNIEIIYSTGESITSVIVQSLSMKKLIYNAYGPAECAVYGLFERMVLGDVITIGVPSDTIRAYILDEEQNSVPRGVQGEIYLAGVQVLQQYINAPEQTALRILSDPWYPEDRMYRTGDYGLCEKDERIIYTGRMDRQVKIRGFRVELDGVEQAILSEPISGSICQCSVIAIDGTLVAYIKFSTEELHSSIDDRINRLRHRLDKTLLPSWVPQLFISLHNFPKSANGKVDNKALEDIYRSRIPLREDVVQKLTVMPTDYGIEHKLAEAWREVLQLQPDACLESSDNFFSLGGHSVLAMLLATKLTSIFEVKVSVRELLPAPTLQDQINTIERLLSAKETNIHQMPSEPDANFLEKDRNALPTEELTELERQVWLQYQVAKSVTAFNIANILTISGQVDYFKLLHSFNAALASDPVLSCNLVEGPDGLRRVIRDSTPRVREVAQLDIAAEINFAFNLEHDELIRLHIIRQFEGKEIEQHKSITQIVIVTSHSIADLATLQNLLRLVSVAYAGENIAVHKRPQHLNSSQWQYIPPLPEQSFWKSYLEGYDARPSQSSCFQLPLLPSIMATFHGSSRTREFHGDIITILNSLIKRLGITHHQMALTIAALLLQWLLNEDDIILGAPNANRSSSTERDALGQFLDRLPIRIKLDSRSSNAGPNLTQILTNVRDSALQALANAIPFSRISELLNVPNGDLKHPIFDCMVTFHPSSASLNRWLQLPLCQVAISPLFPKGSKFPLMLEWFELDSDRWSLHIEHDAHRLPSAIIGIIEVGLQTILEAMADECSLLELHNRLNTATKMSRTPVDGDELVTGSNSGLQGRAPLLLVSEVIDIIRREMASCLGKHDINILPGTSFFSAGADSQAAIALRHRLRALGLEVSLRAIFIAKSPVELISHIIV